MPHVRPGGTPRRLTALLLAATLSVAVAAAWRSWMEVELLFACGLGLAALVALWMGSRRIARSLHRRRRVERALRESERRYRALFESHPFPALVYDPETLGILDANRAAVEQFGYTRRELEELTLRDLRGPADLQALKEQAANLGSGAAQTSRLRTRDGTILEVETNSRAVEFGGRRARMMTVHDVTERKRFEEQFRQVQKMDAVGRLAGGVAHDFNNILNVMLGYADMTMRSLDESDRRRRNLAEILKAGDHAATLTRQLLALARGQAHQPQALDLNVVVEELGPMVRRMIGEDVELVTDFAADLGRVKADPGQVGQVILNLAGNARDAMPAGGTLMIETANVELDGRTAVDMLSGRYVLLAVTDSGSGIPPGIQEHIFEPFFTTKKDKGTGLGLATVYAIVKQAGGGVAVESEVGAGTTFKIYLPRLEASAQSAPTAEPASI